MAITSPGLTLAVEALFAHIRPTLAHLTKLGGTDFSGEHPGFDIAPGATLKVPVSSVAAAGVYHKTDNNYLTGGTTNWATLTATHYLQGFDIAGEDVDSGVSAPRIKQLFSRRAGAGIVMACGNVVKAALDGTTLSTGVTLPAEPTIALYSALAGEVTWLNKAASVLAVNAPKPGSSKARSSRRASPAVRQSSRNTWAWPT